MPARDWGKYEERIVNNSTSTHYHVQKQQRGYFYLCNGVSQLRFYQFGLVGQVEAERRNGNEMVFNSPTVGPLFGRFEGHDSEPVVLPAHGVECGDDLIVIKPHRLARPPHALGRMRVRTRAATPQLAVEMVFQSVNFLIP